MPAHLVRLRAALAELVPSGASGWLVAVSGGADSTRLLRDMAALAEPGAAGPLGMPLRAIHIDHGLTAAAPAFRAACGALCAELGVPLAVVAVGVRSLPGESLEAAAREARYKALAGELGRGECLLTAHHGLDQAETLLLQALRGAGLKGMAGMPAIRPLGEGWHLRPWLALELDEAYVEALAIEEHGARAPRAGPADEGYRPRQAGGLHAAHDPHVVPDPMNLDPRFDRSFLRLEVWPSIERRWPGARGAMARAAAHAAEGQRLLDHLATVDLVRLRDGAGLSIPALRSLAPDLRANAVRHWLAEAGVEAPPTARLGEALRQMLEARDDHQPTVRWGDRALRRYRRRLLVTSALPPRIEQETAWPSSPEAVVELGAGLGRLRWRACRGGLDRTRLPPQLTVRRRAGGEMLRAARGGRTQTVQHLCQAHGVLPWMRDALPMIHAGGALLAVADLWLDAAHRATPDAEGLVVVWEGAPELV